MSADYLMGEFFERLKAAGGTMTFRTLGQTWRAEYVSEFEVGVFPVAWGATVDLVAPGTDRETQ